MSKHTPGPWRIESNSREVLVMAGSFCVATTADSRTGNVPPAKANAALIAAAPDMVEALREVADFWAGGDAPQELTDKINAALAKAGL